MATEERAKAKADAVGGRQIFPPVA